MAKSAVSGHAQYNALQRAKVTEPFGYILKPFSVKDLHSIIEIALYKHQMETKLKVSEQSFVTILNNIGDAVVATDTKGFVTFVNPLAKALTGWEQEEALGKNLIEVLHVRSAETAYPADTPTTDPREDGVIAGLANPNTLIARDGTETPIDHSIAPIRDGKGNTIGVVWVFRDITERKQA